MNWCGVTSSGLVSRDARFKKVKDWARKFTSNFHKSGGIRALLDHFLDINLSAIFLSAPVETGKE